MAAINVIIGPPCAGKSSYIEGVASPGEPMVDFDKIAKAFGSKTAHDPEGSIRLVTYSARQAGINRIINGVDDDAWIIHSNPPADLIEEYKQAGARFLLVDPGIDVCLARARNRPEGTEDAVRKWYASPPSIVAEAESVEVKMSIRTTKADVVAHSIFQNVEGYVDRRLRAILEENKALLSRIDELKNAPPVIGPQGEQGPAGEKGADGADGLPGPKGEKGDPGEPGKDGPRGEKGDPGMDGMPGPQGEKGDAGDPGPKGEKGDPGADGLVGPKGEKGDPGNQGPQGEAGPRGEKGDPGNDGMPGPKGEKGEDGITPSDEHLTKLMEGVLSRQVVEWERRLTDMHQRALDRIEKPKDGIDGFSPDDLDISIDGRNLTVALIKGDRRIERTVRIDRMIYQGVWKDQPYLKDDTVTYSGSIWIAMKDNPRGKPSTANSDWKLAVKKGNDA